MPLSDSQKHDLVQHALEALKNPYAKDYPAVYGAAVLTAGNNMYQGINYFSDTYSLTLHGEQSALAHAATHGEGDVIAIAITSTEEKNKGEFTNPCHLCKQLLWESQRRSGSRIFVILANNHDETKELWLDEMVSFPWPV